MTKKISEKRFLLDVNVLVALANPLHDHHRQSWDWFKSGEVEFATCPLTQLGFLRIILHPVSRLGISAENARHSLEILTHQPNHEFWPDDFSPSTLNLAGIRGHKQWNDAYLLALAKQRNGIVATFDKGFAELARAQQSPIEFVNEES